MSRGLRNRVYVCEPDYTPGQRDDCPNPLHDYPLPSGYIAASDVAASRLHKRWRNVKCRDCGLYGWAPPLGATEKPTPSAEASGKRDTMTDPCGGNVRGGEGCSCVPPFAPDQTQGDDQRVDGSAVGRDDHEPQIAPERLWYPSRAWTIPLPYPRPPLNLNQRMHWAPRNRLTQQIKSDVHTLARLHKLPTGLDRVIVTLHWQPTTNRRRDVDNPSPTLKAAIDGLTQYGLTADDNSAHVWSATIIEPRAAQAAVWLTIEETA